MPTPTSGPISMNDVSTETSWATNLNNFYTLSLAGGLGALMYHNLSMGLGAQTAANAIWVRKDAGTDYLLSNWYNYNQTPNLVMSFEIFNNNVEYDITCEILIYDPSSTSTSSVYTANVPSGSSDSQTDYVTSFVVDSNNLASGIYEIWCNVSCIYIGFTPPGSGVLSNTTVSFDSDGVGAGTTRVDNNIPNFDQFSPLSNVPIIQGNISGTGIYANKRTSFTLNFN